MPTIFDNLTDETRLGIELRQTLERYAGIDVATGYLDLRGWNRLGPDIDLKPYAEG